MTLKSLTYLILIPRNLKLKNFKVLLGNHKIKGKLSIRDSIENNISTKIDVVFSELDANILGLTSEFDSLISSLFTFDYDKTTYSLFRRYDDFSSLRGIKYWLLANISADDVKFRDIAFTGFKSTIEIANNQFVVSDIQATNDRIKFKGSIALDTSNIYPELKANLNFDKADSEILLYLFPQTPKLIAEQYATAQKLLEDPVYKKTNILIDLSAISDLNFYSMHNFDGEVNLTFNNFSLLGTPATDVKFILSLNHGSIIINDLSAKIFGGDAQVVGKFIVDNKIPSFQINYTINNFDPQAFLWATFGLGSITGYMSTAGVLTSSGFDKATMLTNLSLSSSILGRSITLGCFDIAALVKLLDSDQSTAYKLGNYKNYLHSGSTVFDDLQGTINLDKQILSIQDVNLSNKRITGSYSANIGVPTWQIMASGSLSFIPVNSTNPLTLKYAVDGFLNKQDMTFTTDDINKFLNQNIATPQQAPAN
jgi:hypothetical protein